MGSGKIKIDPYLVSCIRWALILVLTLFLIHLASELLAWNRATLGVYPRRMFGVPGILTSAFVHSGWPHLMSNAGPMLVLTSIILYFYRTVAWRSILIIYFFSGLAVWLFARPVYHIGASGVVYGLVAFVFWTGIFRKNAKAIGLGLIVAMLYGSAFFGIMPVKEGVSWESHLFGGIIGMIVAFVYKNELEPDETSDALERYSGESYFLDRDAFDQTKEERENEDNGPPFWYTNST